MTRRKCRRCGDLFAPVKPHHVVCFACYMAQAAEERQARMEVIGMPRKLSRTVTNRRILPIIEHNGTP